MDKPVIFYYSWYFTIAQLIVLYSVARQLLNLYKYQHICMLCMCACFIPACIKVVACICCQLSACVYWVVTLIISASQGFTWAILSCKFLRSICNTICVQLQISFHRLNNYDKHHYTPTEKKLCMHVCNV